MGGHFHEMTGKCQVSDCYHHKHCLKYVLYQFLHRPLWLALLLFKVCVCTVPILAQTTLVSSDTVWLSSTNKVLIEPSSVLTLRGRCFLRYSSKSCTAHVISYCTHKHIARAGLYQPWAYKEKRACNWLLVLRASKNCMLRPDILYISIRALWITVDVGGDTGY